MGSTRLSRREFVAAAGGTMAMALAGGIHAAPVARPIRAGACAIDITPIKFPVRVNGSFTERLATRAHDRLHARCLALDDGTTRLAIVVVDNLLITREYLDAVKQKAHAATGLPIERMLISATHTHSAPALMTTGATRVSEDYARYLPGRIVEAIKGALTNLAPARVGWAVRRAPAYTNCRRWILRSDRMRRDPFGGRTVQANMHPGYSNPSFVGPAGPADDALSILSVQSLDGRPLALLGNFSMHYGGASPVSADFCGVFSRTIGPKLGVKKGDPPFVGILSQGTSGDLHWMDYSLPRRRPLNRFRIGEGLADIAAKAYKSIKHHERVPLAMVERKLPLKVRVPDAKRMAWAKPIYDRWAKKPPEKQWPRSKREVYACQQVFLAGMPTDELRLQVIRVGEFGIAAMPNEMFGITGLKIKALSPLAATMNIELANGASGYIPPPAQHCLGGYTTWETGTARLEVDAAPKIAEELVRMLEEVSGRRRRKLVEQQGPYAKAVLGAKPLAYWRLSEFEGPRALDSSGNGNHGTYEARIAFHLDGPQADGFCGRGVCNRAAHFAGGRLGAVVKGLGDIYSVEFWVWNGFPTNARPVTGYLFSRGTDGAHGAPGDHLAISGTHGDAGKLAFCNGNALAEILPGHTKLAPRTWYHVAMVRDGVDVKVYLNGNRTAEIASQAAIGYPDGVSRLFFGGRNDNFANFEGKLDEIAVYGRALSPKEVAEHFAVAGRLELARA